MRSRLQMKWKLNSFHWCIILPNPSSLWKVNLWHENIASAIICYLSVGQSKLHPIRTSMRRWKQPMNLKYLTVSHEGCFDDMAIYLLPIALCSYSCYMHVEYNVLTALREIHCPKRFTMATFKWVNMDS